MVVLSLVVEGCGQHAARSRVRPAAHRATQRGVAAGVWGGGARCETKKDRKTEKRQKVWALPQQGRWAGRAAAGVAACMHVLHA
jgi:hypothetical protein